MHDVSALHNHSMHPSLLETSVSNLWIQQCNNNNSNVIRVQWRFWSSCCCCVCAEVRHQLSYMLIQSISSSVHDLRGVDHALYLIACKGAQRGT